MIEVKGDYWDYFTEHECDAICCTINTTLKSESKLVMGAGIARAFSDRYRFLEKTWGARISKWTNLDKTYILVTEFDDTYLVGLPTKFDWRHASPIQLVRRSIQQLLIVAEAMEWSSILMTRPGCGHGKLNWENEVKPMMAPIFDDRFIVIH